MIFWLFKNFHMLAEDGFLMPSFCKSLISLGLLFPQHYEVTHREDNFGSSAARSVFWIEILGQEKRTEEKHLCPFRGVMCKYRLLNRTHDLNAQSTLWTTDACALSDTLGLMKPLIHSAACSSDRHCCLMLPPWHWGGRERSPHSAGSASPPPLATATAKNVNVTARMHKFSLKK